MNVLPAKFALVPPLHKPNHHDLQARGTHQAFCSIKTQITRCYMKYCAVIKSWTCSIDIWWKKNDSKGTVVEPGPPIDILYTLDSASNYSAIQKLKPWLQTQDVPMKWEDSYVFYFLNREQTYSKYIFKLFKWWKLLLFFKRLLASGKLQHGRHLFKWG
jgi:hypothetical protein